MRSVLRFADGRAGARAPAASVADEDGVTQFQLFGLVLVVVELAALAIIASRYLKSKTRKGSDAD